MPTIAEEILAAGVAVTPVVLDGRPVEVTWAPDPNDPIVDSRVIIAIPDLHLGDGGDADIFRGEADPGTNVNRDRFALFLAALVTLRQRLSDAGRQMNVVQLGDCYDLWRAYPFHAHVPGQTYAAIDETYGRISARLINDLDARFCVGNHDADLAKYPPDWAFASGGRLAYSQRACAGRVFAMHGHQSDEVAEVMAAQNGQTWITLGSILATISNAAGQALQEYLDRREDTYPGDSGGYPEGAAPDARFQSPRWSDRGARKSTLEKIFQGMAQTAPAVANAMRLLLVGHTHRPGVAWFNYGGRVIPVVDVGSWTYGRSQFAIVEEGAVRLWQIA